MSQYGQIVLTASAADRSARVLEFLGRGFVHMREQHTSTAVAWEAAHEMFAATGPSDALARDMPALEVVGMFRVPPAGVRQRDFQVLHIDFGLPIEPREPVDVARFTALYIDAQRPPTSALTRVVALRSLLSQRQWSDRSVLLARLRRYRRAGRDGARQVEGILARLVEAADDRWTLPAPDDPDYRCGLEFASLAEEHAHFARHSLDLRPVEHHVRLAPGELLLLDNLATAHGRTGVRGPEELHQLCVGYRALEPARQRTLLIGVLAAFGAAED